MATKQRAVDLGAAQGRATLERMLREVETARRDRGIALADLGHVLGVSESTASRLVRSLSADVGIVRLSQACAVVGLELSARAYPGGQPLRDAGHAALLGRLEARLHRSLGFPLEVPFPHPGDRRAWDALVRGQGWRYGVEAETHPTDGQALARRLALKERDGDVDGVLLVVPSTRHVRSFLATVGDLLRPNFPVEGRRALELLGAGIDPGGNALIIL